MIVINCRSQTQHNSISDYVKNPGASEIILQNKMKRTTHLFCS